MSLLGPDRALGKVSNPFIFRSHAIFGSFKWTDRIELPFYVTDYCAPTPKVGGVK